MLRPELHGVPGDIPPGDYATRVREARWEGNDLVVVLDYAGPLIDRFDCLFPIKKHADEEVKDDGSEGHVRGRT